MKQLSAAAATAATAVRIVLLILSGYDPSSLSSSFGGVVFAVEAAELFARAPGCNNDALNSCTSQIQNQLNQCPQGNFACSCGGWTLMANCYAIECPDMDENAQNQFQQVQNQQTYNCLRVTSTSELSSTPPPTSEMTSSSESPSSVTMTITTTTEQPPPSQTSSEEPSSTTMTSVTTVMTTEQTSPTASQSETQSQTYTEEPTTTIITTTTEATVTSTAPSSGELASIFGENYCNNGVFILALLTSSFVSLISSMSFLFTTGGGRSGDSGVSTFAL